MSSGRNRFQLNDAEINRILFCDDSNTEDVLVLEDENIDFIIEMEVNSNTEDIEVIMDPPNDTMVNINLYVENILVMGFKIFPLFYI